MEVLLIAGFIAYVGALYGAKINETHHLAALPQTEQRRLGKTLNLYRMLSMAPLLVLMVALLLVRSGVEPSVLVAVCLGAAAFYGLVLRLALGKSLVKADVEEKLRSRLGATFLLRYAGTFALMTALGFWLILTPVPAPAL